MDKLHYDAIIIGAGLVGTTLALALEQANQRVALIDANPKLTPESANDLRTVALSHASVRWLKKTGVWDALTDDEKSPYTAMCIFEPGSPETLTFSAQEAGLTCLGYMVSHDRLLLKAQSLFQGPTFYHTRLDTWEAIEAFHATHVIGCDGADSFLRQALGITQQVHPYHHSALVAELECSQWHAHTAWQSFSKGEIMGLLPLHDRHRVNMVWSLDTNEAKALLNADPNELEARIQSVFGDRLGTLTVKSRLGMFPLVARHAHAYGDKNIILLGDAIHTVHPLAGQGVNLGFLDAAALMACWNMPSLSAAFERRRKAHNYVTTHLMTALQQGYARTGWMAHARRFGVRALNAMPFIKKWFIDAANH